MASLKKVFLDCMQVRHFSAQTQTAYLRWVNEGADRATAWASTWSLRQFQLFGVAPVTIW
jgi:hypothetical protein